MALNALDVQQLTLDIWMDDLVRGTLTRLTFGGFNQFPVWTSDGKRLLYAFSPNIASQQTELRAVPADNSSSPATLLAGDAQPDNPRAVSPDGRIALGFRNKFGGNSARGGTTGNQLWVLPLAEGSSAPAKPRSYLESQFAKDNPQFSPDGKWVAYQANDSSRDEIYVVPFPGPGGKTQVSADGGTDPRWSRSGRELFYRNDNKMMAVDVETSPSFRAGTPKLLFEKESAAYDVASDGKRFLLIKGNGAPQGQSNELRVVLNWFEELRRHAPVSK